MSLVETDVIYYHGELLEVKDPPVVVNGRVHLPTRRCHAIDQPIVLAVGSEWHNRDATCAVMEYTNADCADFGDGTYMITQFEAGPGAIYSPRLSAQKLEKWCQNNLHRFDAFFAMNEITINRGEIAKMEPWWV